MSGLFITSLEQGLIFAILAIGVFITYKILDIADLTVEGSFPLGAFVFAKAVTSGLDPVSGCLLAFLSGLLAGYLTSFWYLNMRINALLSGILTMTILYSINFRTNGKSNVSLFNYKSIFDYIPNENPLSVLIFLLLIVLVIKLLMDHYLKTESGYLLKAVGDNETLVRSIGVSSKKYKILGLALSNAFVTLSGALMAQNQGFADLTMGNSIIVTALASIIIGDTLLPRSKKLNATTRAVLGAISYKIIMGIALFLGLTPSDLKAISAVIVILFIAINQPEFIQKITRHRTNKQQKVVSQGGGNHVGN